MTYVFLFILACVHCFAFVDNERNANEIQIYLKSDWNRCIVASGPKGFSLRENSPFDSDEDNKGLLIAIIHQVRGKHMIEPYHFQIWSDFQNLESFLDKIQPGRIILLALRGELRYKIPMSFRNYLVREGSFVAQFLGPGVRWSWMYIKGGKTMMEVVTYQAPGTEMASAIEGTRKIHLSDIKEHCPSWPYTYDWNERRKFCDTYELYGDLCSCKNPYIFEHIYIPIDHNQMNLAFTSIIAHRPSLLYVSLKTLLPNPGLNLTRLRVFTQDENQEMVHLLRLLQIPLTSSGLVRDGSVNSILRQYIFVFKYVLQHYGESKFFVFLEDDIRYSPDFYIFLNRTTQLLLEDPSLYCSSAHNDLSYPHTSLDPHTAWRTESYPNCGWMVRHEFVQKLLTLEDISGGDADWDIVAYNYLRESRECIIPEISRSQHFGVEGAHVNSYKARLFFASKNYNLDPTAWVQNVHLLKQDKYERALEDMIRRSIPVDISSAPPCSDDFYEFLESSSSDIITIYFHMETLHHFVTNEEYTILAECLNVYSNSARESHFGLFRMRWKRKHLFLIGYPASRYSSYKPEGTPVLKSNNNILNEARRHSSQRISVELTKIEDIPIRLKEFFH